MFKDDRLISVLSGVLLMAALGMVLQRSDVLMKFLDGNSVAPAADEYTLAAKGRHLLDVLSNDEGVTKYSTPTVVDGPDCGTVRTSGNRLLYNPTGCSGDQVITYRIGEDEDAPVARVAIRLEGADPEVPREQPQAVATAEPSVPRPDLSGSGLPRMAAPAPASPDVAALDDDTAGPGLSIDAPGTPVGRPESPGPTGFGEVAVAPGAVTAPESVSAPRTGAAPGGIDSATADDAAPAPAGTQRAAAAPAEDATVPDGLFGTSARATTQAAPDPSRPAPAVSLDNLLAFAPEPVPAPGQRGRAEPTPDQRLREIANMPDGFAASPQALSAPMIARAKDRPSRSLSLVRVDRDVRSAGPSGLSDGGSVGGLDAAIPRANPVRIGRGQNEQFALADPSAGLGDIRSFQTGTLVPVTVGQPSGLGAVAGRDASILAAQGDAAAEIAAGTEGEDATEFAARLSPVPARRGAEETADADAAPAAEETRVAALPRNAGVCAAEPAFTVDPRPAGRTTLVVASPCHAGSIAELRYSDLRLAIPLDTDGRASVEVLGFEDRSEAVLWFRDGRELTFELPFVGLRRLNRVALVWDAPVVLDLHAFEFGADPGDQGHVFPGNRRSFDEVRRAGGGFLTTYSSIGGIGQNMQIYSYWDRRSDRTGVIELAVDYATRSRERRPETCGGGSFAAPAFLVVRSEDGELQRPLNSRLSAVDCGGLSGRSMLIEAAIDDVIVRGR